MTPSSLRSALKFTALAAALGVSAYLPAWADDIPSPEARAELTTRSGQPYLVLTLPELWVSNSEKYSNAVMEFPAVSLTTGQLEVELQVNDPSVKPFFELSDDRKTVRLPKVRYEGTLLHNVRLKGAAYFPNLPTREQAGIGSKNVAVELLLAGSSVSLANLQGWPAAPVDAVTFCAARYIWTVLDDLVRLYGGVAGSVRYDKCVYSNGVGLIDISAEVPGGNRASVPYVSFRWPN